MARPPATPEARHQQRQKLRQAAADLYEESGVLGVTARAVAKRAGVSAGTLYSYFDGLADLMQSLWTEPLARANARLESIAVECADPVERIRLLLEAYAEFAADNPEVHRNAVLFVRPSSLDKPEPQPADQLPFHRLLREAVEEGQETGVIGAGDPVELTQVLWAGIHGALALPVNIDNYGVQSQQTLATAMIDTLMGTLSSGASGRTHQA